MKKLAVVTVTYNAEQYIDITIKSVLRQSFNDYEYIIIDGKSTDKTVEKAKVYKKYFSERNINMVIISQPDKGVFDAMNLSLNYVNAEYIIFLNAGDFFADSEIINSIFNTGKYLDFDIAYGNYYAYRGNKRKKYIAKPVENLKSGMISSHQAFFTKAELLRHRNFDISYEMASDYDFFADMYLRGISFKKIDKEIVYFDIYGNSYKGAKKTHLEVMDIQKKHGFIDDKTYRKNLYMAELIGWKKKMIQKLPNFIRFHSYETFEVNI